MEAEDVVQRLEGVIDRVKEASKSSDKEVRLVAVSKTKPAWMIQSAYDVGQRHFGENYVQELLDKSVALPKDIRWHMIGHLQSNKAKSLVKGVEGLYCVETLDSTKLATILDRACAEIKRAPLHVYVQVNTSQEASKHGVTPEGCIDIAKHVIETCPNLRLSGLMTIGMPDYTSTPENFRCLASCRDELCDALGLSQEDVELSMGMSSDFELAISMGSTNVRVGSTIFGTRGSR